MATSKVIKHGLVVQGLTADAEVIRIAGTLGTLFSVTDDYSGILHSVADISGVPVFKVEDDGTSTFTGPVIGITPTVDAHLATKKYVDDNAGGGSGTVTSVGTNAPLTGTVTTSGSLSITQATTSTDGYLSSTDWNTFNNKTSNTGTVTSVTGGTGLSSSGGTTPSISLDNTSVVAGTYTNADITVDSQGRLTAAATGSTGGTANNSTITLSAGTGLSTGGNFTTNQASNETITFDFDANSLGVGGTLLATDHLVASNGTISNKQLISSIPLSIFNNDSGWTSNTGDITGVTAGNGITGGATSGTATVTLGTPGSLTASTTNGVTSTSHTHAITGFLKDVTDTLTGTLTISGGDLVPATDNTGNVGTSALTWTNGRFTNLTIDSTLSVRAAIDLADNDNLRFGSSDDYIIDFNGTNLVINENVAGNVIFTNSSDATTITIDPTAGTVVGTSFNGVALTTGGSATAYLNGAGTYTTPATGGTGTVTSVTAGNGMTQTGTSTINPTLNVVGGSGITANANDITLGALTANWDAGGYEIRARTFESDVATGTAPFTVASTTTVTNLNADMVDGYGAGSFVKSAETDSISGAITHTGNYYRFNDNIELYFGTATSQSYIWSSGSHTYWTLTSGNLYIRDGATTRFTFERTTGYFTAVKSFASSSRDIKTNIRPYNNSGLEIVNKMDIQNFDYKDGSGIDAVGVIAEDAPEEIVAEDRKSVDLYNLQFIQAKAIQELSKENDELKKKNAEMEKRLERLENIIHTKL